MKEKISIIVPIYNTEKYLKKCITSIINQTYSNLEIILINDGSTDNSLKICEEFKENDKRIRIISQENMGVAYSRNLGIKVATGTFIGFVDSDDVVENNMFERLYTLIKKYKADISMCEFNVINEKEEIISNKLKKNKISIKKQNDYLVLKGDKKFDILYGESETGLVAVVIWNKLYSSKVIKKLKYKDGTIHEDETIAHIILNKANKIIYTREKLYKYRKRQGSITSKEYSIERQEVLIALDERYKFFKKTNRTQLAKKALKEYISMIIIHYKHSLDYNLGRENLKYLRQKVKEKLKDIVFCGGVGIRLVALSFYFFPRTTIQLLLHKWNLSLYN